MNTKRNQLIVSAMMLSFAACGPASAEDEPAKPAAPTGPVLSDVLTASGLTATGYVAASYYHSNGYSTDHQFDNKHDTFQLDQAALTIAYQPKEGFGALVNVAAGEDMKILNAAEGSNSNTFDVVQGFVQYVGGPVTVIAGKYVTLAGAEVIAPTGNTNFSRSFLFYAEPLTHTGIRATYALSDTLSVVGGVNNGWNYSSLTTSGSKTGEVGLAWTPSKAFALAAQAYVGKDPTFDAQRTLVDAVATYNATEALTFILTFDWGKQKQQKNGDPDLNWNGAAFYTNYALNDQWRVSARVEYLDDKEGFVTGTGIAQTLKEGTLTFGYDPVKNFELRIEGRYDKSTQPTFVRKILEVNQLADSQTGVALQGIYKF
ncbi:MAG TPA: outer membrane beta-barrel protein [Steroidobacteraceae bacterium]|nr:outer membrane beta-barrel protein [Steroidobacteraceae bacterium]